MFAAARVVALVVGATIVCGCGDAPQGLRQPDVRKPPGEDPPSRLTWFADATDGAGLVFTHVAARAEEYFLPASTGSGAAIFDYDNDELLDVLLLQNGGPGSGATHRLFRQQPDGRFVDVGDDIGLAVDGHGMGVAIGDVNNDGWRDVVITEYGGVRLFLNKEARAFADVTAESGLDNPLWGASTAFVDFDRDGWLDLLVVNYLNYDPVRWCGGYDGRQDFCGPKAFPGQAARLFRNLGAAAGRPPQFEDVTFAAGLTRQPGPGLGAFCADFDGDRWPDLFVTNDARANHLWINRRNGTFVDEAVARGLAYSAEGIAEANMGIAVGDVNGDGDFDIFVTHLTDESNRLWVQGPRGIFEDRTVSLGLGGQHARGTGFGAVLADFDNDGALDLAVANGRVKRDGGAQGATNAAAGLDPFWRDYAERCLLFANDGDGRFRNISDDNRALCGEPVVARGIACGDLDGDGGLDLVVTCIGAPARLYRNVAPQRGHWLLVQAIDPTLKRDAYGAEITVRAGDRRWRRLINPGHGFLCSHDPRAHFGLGQAERVDAIEVVWPDGMVESFAACPVDQPLLLKKGEGTRDERSDR